jgi:ribA/ribD-fused uncharacterized protein
LLIALAGCQPHDATRAGVAAPAATEASPGSDPMRIREFRGRYAFLSSDWPADVEFEGAFYPTAAHAIAAARTTDPVERRVIASQGSPADARRRADAVQLRPDWDRIKFDAMERIVRDKFTRHPALREKLRRTGDAFIEYANTDGDRVWGVSNGVGENRLGIILMKVRDEARYGAPAPRAGVSP